MPYRLLSTKKYSAFVDEKIKTENLEHEPKDWLAVYLPVAEVKGNDYKQIKNSYVPAVLYWGWNSTIECETDPYTTGNFIKAGIFQAADNLDLRSKLKDKQLVIDLKQVPGKFLYENKGNAIFLVFAYTTSAVAAVSPYPITLYAEYQLKENGEVVAHGSGVIQKKAQPVRNMWKSSKKFTWMYLDEYKKESNRMGTELVKNIIKQIKS
ncbi:hypothetical protein [Pontibacter oryzae]|uniref:Uncharacterized protein n=1 Tax=Pontibacter oryzae TaxID=2304593 RepID=A0A399S4S9_9BACT|nr:hypothetical protein [Pontibacter oryzae]RIJ37072.1 hypothetical protein D1627_14790 [Pontibacter oryzae]